MSESDHDLSKIRTIGGSCVRCGRVPSLWSECVLTAWSCPVRGRPANGAPNGEATGATRIISVNQPGYEIVLFFNSDGGAEAVITRPGGKEPIGVNIAPPIPGRRIVVERKGSAFEVSYKDAPR